MVSLPFINFQKQIKTKIKSVSKINHEINELYTVFENVIKRIKQSLFVEIITQLKFNEYLKQIEIIYDEFTEILQNKITIKTLQSSIILKISKIKLKLINLIKTCGCTKIKFIFKLLLTKKQIVQVEKKDLYRICNKYFNPTDFTFYTKKKDIIQLQKKTTLQNCKKITIQKLNKTDCCLIETLFGANIYIPIDSKTLLLISGYFIQDSLNLTKLKPPLYSKQKKLNELIKKNIEIPHKFQIQYSKQFSLRDFLILTPIELLQTITKSYKLLLKIKKKNISQIVKDFLTQSIDQQLHTLSLLLLNTNDTQDTEYLAYLLYDMICNDSYLLKQKTLSEKVYFSLHWSIQKLFKIPYKKDNLTIKDTFNIEKIPYEKRINLMNVSDTIKNKAFSKLKEIQSSKGETNAKAQQYLDGILKIPFNIYKKESIMIFLQQFVENIKLFCFLIIKDNRQSELVTLSNNFIQNNNKTSKYLEIFIDKLVNLVQNNFIQTNKKIVNFLKKYKVKQLQDILTLKNIPFKGLKKTDLIKLVLSNYLKLSCDNEQLCNFLENTILTKTFTIYNDWIEYLDKRKLYLQQIDETLDTAVYGMKSAKTQIKRIIAQWINGKDSGYVFGFEGPPGTGKTTLAKKGIAMAIKDENGNPRPFVFIALGGSSNGSTLEGHNYTYVGSTWGKIVDSLIETECMNPIIYIDELDKISKTEHGKELIGILIHMTDPSQNDSFQDKYFSGVNIDISKCLIIFSYNDPNNIDSILLDRIHRIKTKQLTKQDKFQIVSNYLLPDILKSVGFNSNDIILSKENLLYIIDTYTNEAGVRKLKEILYEIIRELNLQYLIGTQTTFPIEITQPFINDIFTNKSKIIVKKIGTQPQIGLVNGLYATSTGLGGITLIQTTRSLSKEMLHLELTGQQGDVMKESMCVSKTVAWNLLTPKQRTKISKGTTFGIHIHCPEAATPKDGPSAGAAITLAIYSLLTGKKVNNIWAITGEIDLNGNILAIGGLSSKVEGAKKAGVKFVLCPYENKDDVEKIKKETQSNDEEVTIIMVKHIDEVIQLMLLENSNTNN